jgi:hypothetical protein
MPAFINNCRRCCVRVVQVGAGIGAAVATLRFRAAAALEAELKGGSLSAALGRSGAIGAKAWRSDLAATFPDGPPHDAVPELIVVVEGITPAAAKAGADALLGTLREAGAPLHRGLYRLLHALPS